MALFKRSAKQDKTEAAPAAPKADAPRTIKTFKYTAQNADGKIFRGTMAAYSESDLYDQLLDQGLYLSSSSAKNLTKKAKKLKPKVLSEFNQELCTLLSAGVSLTRAMTIITSEESLNDNVRRVYEEVLADIRRGTKLSDALENQEVFPDLMVGMIRSGEDNGQLASTTNRLSIQYEKEHNLNQKVRSALTYPLCIAILALAVVVILFTFVLPQFEELFQDMNDLPGVTKFLMGVSTFITTKWYWLIVIALVLFVAVKVILGIPSVKFAFDKAKLKLPVIGKLNRIIYTARFARTLSSLYNSGTPIPQSLQITRGTIGNEYLASQFPEVYTKVTTGVPLSAALRGVDGLQIKLASTIQIGEESGQLGTMLDTMSDSMERDAEESMNRMMTILEPVLIVALAAIVAFIMLGVLLPIIGSYGTIESRADVYN